MYLNETHKWNDERDLFGEIDLINLRERHNVPAVRITGIRNKGWKPKSVKHGMYFLIFAPFYVKIVNECNDCDDKTRMVRKPKPLKVGEEYLVKSILRNFYGEFVIIEANNYSYSIRTSDVSYTGMIDGPYMDRDEYIQQNSDKSTNELINDNSHRFINHALQRIDNIKDPECISKYESVHDEVQQIPPLGNKKWWWKNN